MLTTKCGTHTCFTCGEYHAQIVASCCHVVTASIAERDLRKVREAFSR